MKSHRCFATVGFGLVTFILSTMFVAQYTEHSMVLFTGDESVYASLLAVRKVRE